MLDYIQLYNLIEKIRTGFVPLEKANEHCPNPKCMMPRYDVQTAYREGFEKGVSEALRVIREFGDNASD